MSCVLQVIGFMALGGVIVEIFEIHAWRRYQQGKREGSYPVIKMEENGRIKR